MGAKVRAILPAVLVGLAVIAFAVPAAAAAPLGHGVARFGVSSTTSTNWGGYAVTSGKGTVTDVKGSWIVPAIQGTCPSSARYSSFWVGIDGYSSSTVEQTGTDSDCQGGSAVYYAWYEFYPHPSHLFSGLAISAGDTISAEVKFSTGAFTVQLTDVTTGHSASTSSKLKTARNSAEWIAEAPSGSSGILPLADFGKVRFGYDNTSVKSTDDATISGVSAAFGTFTNLHALTMVNKAGTANKATPSAVSSDSTSFSVTWVSAGP